MMTPLIERLAETSVADVMARNVVTVSANHSMERAAALLAESRLSGAPVVDETGRCVGVLTASDFLRREATSIRREPTLAAKPEGIQVEEPLEGYVHNYMTAAVQTVQQTESALTAAKMMCQEQVNRLIVLDEDSRPTGVVTALDLLSQSVCEECDKDSN